MKSFSKSTPWMTVVNPTGIYYWGTIGVAQPRLSIQNDLSSIVRFHSSVWSTCWQTAMSSEGIHTLVPHRDVSMLSMFVDSFLLSVEISRARRRARPTCCREGQVIVKNNTRRWSSGSLFQMARQDYHENHVCLVRIEHLICLFECICWVCGVDVDRDPENSKEFVGLHKVHKKMICEEHARSHPHCCPRLDEDSVDPMVHLLPTSPRNKESVLSQPIPSRSVCSFSSWEIVQEKFGWLPLRVLIFIHPRVASISFFLSAVLLINEGWIASKVCRQWLAYRSRTQATITVLVYSPFCSLREQLLQGLLLVVVQIEITISLANLSLTDLTNESANETVIYQPLHVNCHPLNAFEIG